MIPIDIPPGVTNHDSKARMTSAWREAHLMRWDGITLQPIKGWQETPLGPFASKLRQMHRWLTNDGVLITAYLCELHLYVDMGENIVDITPVGGLAAPSGNNAGYGDGQYSTLDYGEARPGAPRLTNYTPIYTLDNWGDELRAMTSGDGRLLRWAYSDPPGTLATAVIGAPISNRTFVITPERHIMLFGLAGELDEFGWSDEEDDTNWNFLDVTSKAGKFNIEPSSPIVTVKQFYGGILMFTMTTAFIIQFQGMPYIYGYREVGEAPVPISPASIAETPDGVMWPSIDGFWLYTGTSIAPVPCDILDWVRRNVDGPNSTFQAYMVNMSNRSELWWFFVGNEVEGQFDNTKVVIYDYRDKWWSMGKLGRSCGFVYGNDMYPIMSDGYKVYQHGFGHKYAGTDMPWIETFSLNMNEGAVFSTVNEIQPEIVGDRDAIRISLIKRNDRTRPAERTGPARKAYADGRFQFRETAKDFRMRIQMVEETPWTIGPLLFDVKPRGKKTTDKNG